MTVKVKWFLSLLVVLYLVKEKGHRAARMCCNARKKVPMTVKVVGLR